MPRITRSWVTVSQRETAAVAFEHVYIVGGLSRWCHLLWHHNYQHLSALFFFSMTGRAVSKLRTHLLPNHAESLEVIAIRSIITVLNNIQLETRSMMSRSLTLIGIFGSKIHPNLK